MPCFRDRIVVCGDDKQRRMLDEVGKMLMFLCSPFSVDRQRQLMEYSACIGNILTMPATTGCNHSDHALGKKLAQCREACGPKQDFICLMRTWVSEQSVCTAIDIEKKCGADAAHFYNDLQRTVFEPRFPLICDISPSTENSTSVNEISTLVPPLVYTVTAMPVDPAVETNTLNISQLVETSANNFWSLKNIGLVTATPPTVSTDSSTTLTTTIASVHENFYNRFNLMSSTLPPIASMTAETFWPQQRETLGPVMFPTRFDPWTRRNHDASHTNRPLDLAHKIHPQPMELAVNNHYHTVDMACTLHNDTSNNVIDLNYDPFSNSSYCLSTDCSKFIPCLLHVSTIYS
uniref:Uncharacterized protein n=1 Tax=Plectus sambesii TaxID=2011161 RepID=A0A914V6E0_9BILA